MSVTLPFPLLQFHRGVSPVALVVVKGTRNASQDGQTRAYTSPFCRTLTAYGVIKSPIYSSRARHQRPGPVSFTKSRTAERSFTISIVVFNCSNARRHDAKLRGKAKNASGRIGEDKKNLSTRNAIINQAKKTVRPYADESFADIGRSELR